MGLLRRQNEYDRLRVVNAASAAAAKRRWRRAIGLYWRVLAVEPGNPDLLARIAPLLARKGQTFDAYQSYRGAAEGYLRQGRSERAIATCREATRTLPRDTRTWTQLARLLRHARADREAVQVLLEGRRRFRGRRRRPEAIHLLRRVLQIDPEHFAASRDLARLLAAQGRKHESVRILDELALRVDPRSARRVRATQFNLNPSLANAWHWLRTLFGGAAAPGPRGAFLPFSRSSSPRR